MMSETTPVLAGAFVHAGAHRVHYLEGGPSDGPSVVLLHGLSSLGQEMFTPLAGPLAARGYRVIAPDRPGYGLSDPLPGRKVAPRSQARWLLQALDALGARRPIIAAHSAGAAPAVALTVDPRTRPRGLVLINPFSRPTRPAAAPLLRLATAPLVGRPIRRQVLPRLAPFIGSRMVRYAAHPDPSPERSEAFPYRHMARETAVTAMAAELLGFHADMARVRTALRRARTPTIILAGQGDRVIDMPAHARWLERRMPRAEVRWAPGGHMLHHAHPEAVVQAIDDIAARR